jgi:hypothetical protein
MISRFEIRSDSLFDIVIRLRDDAFALENWSINASSIKGYIVTENRYQFGGLNDHTITIDRLYADDVFRGGIEDYYLNFSVPLNCTLSEQQIKASVDSYRIPSKLITLCNTPVIPLRGRSDMCHWKLHQVYASEYYGLYKNHHSHCFKQSKSTLKYLSNHSVPMHSVEKDYLIRNNMTC